ncbi:MAG: flagellar hook basal-body protein [Candidatus Eremiobacteraeota bacterium]|nr:flagellar hook basal-body protein [Candidatus Eremiobacteraeota bacterium]
MDTQDALAAAAAGMRLQADTLDVIAQNLANIATPGFRARDAAFARFGDELQARVGMSSSQGALRRTDVPTDLALSGAGYLAVATPDGVRYTRDGRMSVDPHGYLVDQRGNRVLGSLGPVHFPQGSHVDEEGRVYSGGIARDRLRIVSFDAEFAAGDLFAAPPGCLPKRATARVHAGFVEDSGVDAMTEMTALIATQRAYEANEKSAARTDESLRRVVTDLPTARS